MFLLLVDGCQGCCYRPAMHGTLSASHGANGEMPWVMYAASFMPEVRTLEASNWKTPLVLLGPETGECQKGMRCFLSLFS